MVGGCSWEVSSQDLYVLLQWNQLKGLGLYTTNTANSVGNVSQFWGVVLSWNSCWLWEESRPRTVLCFQPLSAAVLGFEASALGTASGRGVWREEAARQGMEGLLLLP